MAKNWASLEVTGKNGAKHTSTNHDAAEAKKAAEAMRKQKDIQSVNVRKQDRGPY